MAINMMCMQSRCKYYWEDNCTRNLNEERIVIDEFGKCETFEEGKSNWYEHGLNEDIKMHKCIKGFQLEECDDDGFTLEGEYLNIEEGSIWHIPDDEDYRLIDGEIRLENDKNDWIEISNEILEKHFEDHVK